MSYYPNAAHWVATADTLTPTLHRHTYLPVARVRPEVDAAGCQGWRMVVEDATTPLPAGPLGCGATFVLDFGEEIVGYFTFNAVVASGIMDAPLRVQLIFAEVPAEVAEPFDPYTHGLSRSWLQDEVVNLDLLEGPVTLPRRYAFRYVRVTVVDTAPAYKIRFTAMHVAAVSAVPFTPLVARTTDPDLAAIEVVSLRTLRNCMQTVFEDGPKRDRRLWLGDLRLMAQANYVSFGDFALAKRCLYLFAGLAREDGWVPACVYERPQAHNGQNYILEYALFFGPTLLDYAVASGDWATACALWPVAQKQVELALGYVDERGIFAVPAGWWIFMDWCQELDKQAAMQGALIYTLRQLHTLATHLGETAAAKVNLAQAERLSAAARAHLWDAHAGLFISGPTRQLSWATQTWMILGGVVDVPTGAKLLRALPAQPTAVRPNGPYLWHHVAEAMLRCGLHQEALDLIRHYWGGMVALGATTFWEVYRADDLRLSPYNNFLINSYCHAWSSTPVYLLRQAGC